MKTTWHRSGLYWTAVCPGRGLAIIERKTHRHFLVKVMTPSGDFSHGVELYRCRRRYRTTVARAKAAALDLSKIP